MVVVFGRGDLHKSIILSHNGSLLNHVSSPSSGRFRAVEHRRQHVYCHITTSDSCGALSTLVSPSATPERRFLKNPVDFFSSFHHLTYVGRIVKENEERNKNVHIAKINHLYNSLEYLWYIHKLRLTVMQPFSRTNIESMNNDLMEYVEKCGGSL